MKKSFSKIAGIILLSLLVVVQFIPVQILAAEPETESNAEELVYYTKEDGTVASQNNVKILTSADANITTLTASDASCNGWYAVKGEVTINNSANNCLNCEGEVHLILLDGSSLAVQSTLGTAMSIKSGNSLTITSGNLESSDIAGTGKLSCIGKDDKSKEVMGAAGIGYGNA